MTWLVGKRSIETAAIASTTSSYGVCRKRYDGRRHSFLPYDISRGVFSQKFNAIMRKFTDRYRRIYRHSFVLHLYYRHLTIDISIIKNLYRSTDVKRIRIRTVRSEEISTCAHALIYCFSCSQKSEYRNDNEQVPCWFDMTGLRIDADAVGSDRDGCIGWSRASVLSQSPTLLLILSLKFSVSLLIKGATVEAGGVVELGSWCQTHFVWKLAVCWSRSEVSMVVTEKHTGPRG